MLGMNVLQSCCMGLPSAHAGLSSCSTWARSQLRGRLLGTPDFTGPAALGARQDSVNTAITVMHPFGAGDDIGAQPSSLVHVTPAADVCVASSFKHDKHPAARHKAVSLSVLGVVAAVSSQDAARKDVHSKNMVTLARVSIDDAKTYIRSMATSGPHFAAAHRAWSDLPTEVCPEHIYIDF